MYVTPEYTSRRFIRRTGALPAALLPIESIEALERSVSAFMLNE